MQCNLGNLAWNRRKENKTNQLGIFLSGRDESGVEDEIIKTVHLSD